MLRNLLTFVLLYSVCISLPAQSPQEIAKGSWELFNDFPGGARDDANAFSLNGAIYYGGGVDTYYELRNDWWMYDTSAEAWTRLKDLPETGRQYATVVVTNDHAILIGGQVDTGFTNQCFQFSAGVKEWRKLPLPPFKGRAAALGFFLGNAIYFGSGRSADKIFNDFWRLDLRDNSWTRLNDLPFGNRYEMIAFEANGYGYALLGLDSNEAYSDVWKFDGLTEEWEPTASFPGNARSYAEAVEEPGGAFVLGGEDEMKTILSEAYYFESETEDWIRMNDLILYPVKGLSGVRVGSRIYAIGGITDNFTRLSTIQGLRLNSSEIDPVVRIGPNPATEVLHIYVNSDPLYENRYLNFYNLQGRLIAQRTYAPGRYLEDLNVRDWEAGIYWLRFYQDGKERVIPVIVRP